MIDRILDLIKKSGLSIRKVALQCDLSAGSVADWKVNRSKPSADAIIKLAAFFNVSTDYLLTGKEFAGQQHVVSFQPLTKQEQKLLDNFRQLNESNKDAAAIYMQVMKKQTAENEKQKKGSN